MDPTLLGILIIFLSVLYCLANHLNQSSNFADLICLLVIALAVGIIRRKEWARKGLVAAAIVGVVWMGREVFDWFYLTYFTDQIKLREGVSRFGYFLNSVGLLLAVLFFFSYIALFLSRPQTKGKFFKR